MTLHYLRTERQRRGWTQVELAAAAGLAQHVISKLERNPKARPSFAIHTALADALEIDPASLRFGLNPRQVPHGKAARRRRKPAPPSDPPEVSA